MNEPTEERLVDFKALVERVPAVVYVDAPDSASSNLYTSPKVEAMLGYVPEEWLADPELWRRALHPEDRGRVLAEHDRARESNGTFSAEYRLLSKDGHTVWVRDEAVPAEVSKEGGRQRLGVLVDITERKLYEERLAEEEGRYRTLFENVREGIASVDEKGFIVHCNSAYARVLGSSPEALAGRSFFDFLSEEQTREANKQHDLRKCAVGSNYELTVTLDDGVAKILSCGGYPLLDSEGGYVGSVQTVADVTERRRREWELVESERVFRLTFQAAAVGIAHVSPDGRWLRVNDELCRISGYSRTDLEGMDYRNLVPPDEDPTRREERVSRLLAGEIGPYKVERRYVRKDGSRVWVDLSVSLARDRTGNPDYLICFARDITEDKLSKLVPDPLTPREREVLELAALQRTNAEIAGMLNYSLGTVKLEMRHVISKLGVENRKQAIERAFEIGAIPKLHVKQERRKGYHGKHTRPPSACLFGYYHHDGCSIERGYVGPYCAGGRGR